MVNRQEVKLHGGPRHGDVVALPMGRHVVEIAAPIIAEDEERVVAERRGQYSRVGDSQDFEWDGWIR